jgi:hypothetical protein
MPDSLTAKLLKAKYHPDYSILEAPMGKNPSFAWRSIHNAIGLIQEGLIWRIGNDKIARI